MTRRPPLPGLPAPVAWAACTKFTGSPVPSVPQGRPFKGRPFLLPSKVFFRVGTKIWRAILAATIETTPEFPASEFFENPFFCCRPDASCLLLRSRSQHKLCTMLGSWSGASLRITPRRVNASRAACAHTQGHEQHPRRAPSGGRARFRCQPRGCSLGRWPHLRAG